MLLLEINNSEGEHKVQDKYFTILERWKKAEACRMIQLKSEKQIG